MCGSNQRDGGGLAKVSVGTPAGVVGDQDVHSSEGAGPSSAVGRRQRQITMEVCTVYLDAR